MSKGQSTLLANLNGRLGNIILYTVAGETRMRSASTRYRDRKSDEQLQQRQKFIRAGKLYHELGHPIYLIWKRHAKGSTLNGYTLFIQHNVKNFTNQGKIADLSKLEVSCGALSLPILFELLDCRDNCVTFSWSNAAGMLAARESDLLQVACYQPTREKGRLVFPLTIPATKRQDELCHCPVVLPAGSRFHLYAYFKDRDEEIYSPSNYTGSFFINDDGTFTIEGRCIPHPAERAEE